MLVTDRQTHIERNRQTETHLILETDKQTEKAGHTLRETDRQTEAERQADQHTSTLRYKER